MTYTEQDKLWQSLTGLAFHRSHFWARGLYVISYADFEKYSGSFKKSLNVFNAKENYRSRRAFKHIHAIKTGDRVEFHMDYGNPDLSLFMYIPHTLIDVIPYFLYFFLNLKVPYKIY